MDFPTTKASVLPEPNVPMAHLFTMATSLKNLGVPFKIPLASFYIVLIDWGYGRNLSIG